MKTGTKCRLKYFPEMEVSFVSSASNIAYVRRLNNSDGLPFPVPISELEPVQEWPKTWEELDIEGFYIVECNIHEYNVDQKDLTQKDVFASHQQAEAALAMAQLSQLHKAIVGDWEADWKNRNVKYCIERFYFDELFIEERIHSFRYFPFQTREQAEFSLEHHRELWEKFYQVKK